MYTLPDAVRLKDHILERWEAADRDPELVDDGALNIVVVGGGPTGIESAGALAELYRATSRKDYPDVPAGAGARHPRRGRPDALSDVQGGHPRVHREGPREARRRGDARRGGRVGLADARHAEVGNRDAGAHARLGRGLQGDPLVQALGLELQRGNRIAVGPELTAPGHPEMYAVGDIAAITDAKTRQVLPQLGSVALQSGEHAGETIARRSRGRRRSRSSTTTRARWRRSGAAPRWCSCRRPDDEGQDGPGWRGAPCTWRCSRPTRTARRRSSTGPGPGSRTSGRPDHGRDGSSDDGATHDRRRELRRARARRGPARTNAGGRLVFGITGDLAKVMTFRSLYRLEQRGLLDCPIVGVAVDDWTVDQLVERARELDRRHRRAARRGGVRPLRRAPLLRRRRLRRRRDVRAGRRGDQAAPSSPSSTSRSRRSCSARSSRACTRRG